jgi:hypothetical protein
MALLGAIRAWNCSAANCGSYWADFGNVELNPTQRSARPAMGLLLRIIGEGADQQIAT